MSGISSNIGLISGIDRAQLIDQLIALEARPVRALEQRVRTIDGQRAAYSTISASLLAAQNAALRFKGLSLFRRFSAVSSNVDAVSATASDRAAAGAYSFRVRAVASSHSVLSRGFEDADRTPVGAGTITIEVGRGQVNRGTELDGLNGGAGVRRGVITITDRSGASAAIDLSAAVTVSDVLDAINSNTNLNVRARVTGSEEHGNSGDRIVIEDLTGSTNSNLIVADANGGATAADLGILANVAADRIDGLDLVRLTSSTPLAALNDGNGISRLPQGRGDDLRFVTSAGEFTVSLGDVVRGTTDLRLLNQGQGVRLGVVRVTDRTGRSADIDLTTAKTVQDVLDKLNGAGLAVDATITNASFQIRDTIETNSPDALNLKIEDISGSAAADLGIAADVADDVIGGRAIYRVSTIGDVIRTINLAPGNTSLVQAALSSDGKSMTLRGLSSQDTVTVEALNGSEAAKDLGIEGARFNAAAPFQSRRLIAGLNTVLLESLRGGSGVSRGTVRFTDSAQGSAVIDFSAAATLQDVVDLINGAVGARLHATINASGTGIAIRDLTTGGGRLAIEDMSGSLAADLGISTAGGAGTNTNGVIEGANLQLRYISRQTLLKDLSSGQGFAPGRIQITDSTGTQYFAVISANAKTVGDAIDAIDLSTPDSIEVRVNDTGDGIIIVDHSEGSKTLAIEDVDGGRAAADLHIAGSAKTGERQIDGSFEYRIELSAGDTLNDVQSKLNAAGGSFRAVVVNNGTGTNPFSLTITSAVSGRLGALVIDSQGVDLGLRTLSRPQDAVISLGADAGSLVVISSTNRFSDVVNGVTLDVLATTPSNVTVTVAQDVDAIVEAIRSFVDAYNDVQTAIDEKTFFNQDTQERGPLLGDSTVSNVRSRLQRLISQRFAGTQESVSRLFSVGVRLGANNRLEFDEDRFRRIYETSPEAVEALFSEPETGAGSVLEETITGLTRSFDGVLSRRDDALVEQKELLNDRIEGLNALLTKKRERLEAQFIGLETALAALQAQQNSLTALARLASTAPR